MITSTKNPNIVAARKLTQRKHRQRQNRFLVEGLQLLGMAVEARAAISTMRDKIIPRQIFYCEELFTGDTAPRLLNQLTEAGAEAIPVAPQILDTLSERDTSQGLAVTFALDELNGALNEIEAAPSTPQLALILDQLQDPGNLGTLIRTADAVGAAAVILLEPCVDPFDPKTIRSTMGSIFTIPLVRAQEAKSTLTQLSEMGYRLVGADATLGETAWQSDALSGSVGLILGNEARGLSDEIRANVRHYVSLPLRGYAESLNVSIAGGILMYNWLSANQEDLF